MKVISSTYSLPQNIKSAENNPVKRLPSVPSFKARKLIIEQELRNSVSDTIKANSSLLKDIMGNQAQRKTFSEALGSIIVSTAVAITQAIQGNNSIETAEKIIDTKKDSDIKFSTTRGKSPQIEKDIIAFTNEHFEDDAISSDKIKLLFNEYCGKNRNGKHLFEGQFVDNKVLIKTIFEELKENCEDKSQLYATISKYMDLKHIDGCINSQNNSDNIIEKAKELSDVDKQDTKKTDEQFLQIKTLLGEFETTYKLDNIIAKQALKNIKKNFSEDLEELLFITQSMDSDEDKKTFVIAMANKTISSEAVKTYSKELRNKGLTFLQYNNFKKLNLSDDAIKQLTKLMLIKRIKNVTDIGEPNSFSAVIPGTYTINAKFKTIRDAFEIVNNQKVTLSSHEDTDFDKNSLVNELKFDFMRNGNHTTYKNIVAYLYGNKHEVNTLKDFEKNQYDAKFANLISLLNNDKIFNKNLFSNHSKLRFMERYVLTEASANKNLGLTTRNKVRHFIEALKRELGRGVNINQYYADENQEITGIQIRFNDPQLGVVKITLNDKEKMHTII